MLPWSFLVQMALIRQAVPIIVPSALVVSNVIRLEALFLSVHLATIPSRGIWTVILAQKVMPVRSKISLK